MGAAGAERRVTNVAAGLDATDAVNLSQLLSEDAKVNAGAATAAALGGDAAYSSTTGAITAPSCVLGGGTNNVGSALTNFDGRVTQNSTDITTLTNERRRPHPRGRRR